MDRMARPVTALSIRRTVPSAHLSRATARFSMGVQCAIILSRSYPASQKSFVDRRSRRDRLGRVAHVPPESVPIEDTGAQNRLRAPYEASPSAGDRRTYETHL